MTGRRTRRWRWNHQNQHLALNEIGTVPRAMLPWALPGTGALSRCPSSPGKKLQMRILSCLLTASLLCCLLAPPLVQAGGDLGKDPYDVGEKYFGRKDYVTALKYYRRALGQEDLRAHYRMGQIFEATGKGPDALKHYRQFIDLGRPDAYRSDAAQRITAIEERLSKETTRSTELLDRGKSLFAKGKYLEAEEVLLQAASLDEGKAEIHFYLGEVYMKLEKYGKAKSEYDKVKGSY